jgi:hypothetical protein
MSSLYARGNAILPYSGVDFSAAQGKAVKFVNGVPAVHDSATVPATGIILEGNVAAGVSSIGILGGLPAPVLIKIAADSAALKFGDTVMQKNDGTWTKDVGAGTGRAVGGTITDLKGAVAGDLVEAQTFAPQIRA